MGFAPEISWIELSSAYNIGLDVVLSTDQTQEAIIWALEWEDSKIVLPTKKEIIEIWQSVAHVGNALNNWWLESKPVLPTDMAQISNIHEWRNNLSAMIAHLLSITSVDKSENPINSFSQEHEFKVLDIDFDDFTNRLKWEWFTELYRGRIHDVYNEFHDPEIRLDNFKAINRNRFKVWKIEWVDDIYQRLFTLKRKLNEEETEWKIGKIDARKAFELEYLITQWNFRYFAMSQNAIWLQPFREKVKNRWAFMKEFKKEWVTVKVDIDKYEGIPYIAEFEISRHDWKKFGDTEADIKLLDKILKQLWVEGNDKVWWWSRKLFEYYNKKYFYFFT